MTVVPACLFCLVSSFSLGLGVAEGMDATALLQSKATQHLSPDRGEHFSEAYMQKVGDQESEKALGMAIKSLAKMGQNVSKYGQASNITIRHYTAEDVERYAALKQNASKPADEHNDKKDVWLDYVLQVTPIIGVKPTSGNIGPYFELRIPKLGCDLQGEGSATWGAYFADKVKQCFTQFDTMNTKIQLFMGLKTREGDLVYIVIDANSRMAEVGLGGWFNTGWGALNAEDADNFSTRRNPAEPGPDDPKYYFYPGMFHQHVLAIDGAKTGVLPKTLDLETTVRNTYKWNGPNYSSPGGGDWAVFQTESFQLPNDKGKPKEGPEGEKTGVGGPWFFEVNADKDGPGFELRGSVHYQKPCSWFPEQVGFLGCPKDRCRWTAGGVCEAKPPDAAPAGLLGAPGKTLPAFGRLVKKNPKRSAKVDPLKGSGVSMQHAHDTPRTLRVDSVDDEDETEVEDGVELAGEDGPDLLPSDEVQDEVEDEEVVDLEDIDFADLLPSDEVKDFVEEDAEDDEVEFVDEDGLDLLPYDDAEHDLGEHDEGELEEREDDEGEEERDDPDLLPTDERENDLGERDEGDDEGEEERDDPDLLPTDEAENEPGEHDEGELEVEDDDEGEEEWDDEFLPRDGGFDIPGTIIKDEGGEVVLVDDEADDEEDDEDEPDQEFDGIGEHLRKRGLEIGDEIEDETLEGERGEEGEEDEGEDEDGEEYINVEGDEEIQDETREGERGEEGEEDEREDEDGDEYINVEGDDEILDETREVEEEEEQELGETGSVNDRLDSLLSDMMAKKREEQQQAHHIPRKTADFTPDDEVPKVHDYLKSAQTEDLSEEVLSAQEKARQRVIEYREKQEAQRRAAELSGGRKPMNAWT